MSTVTTNAEQHDIGASDNDLMLRVQAGDREAFAELVGRLYIGVLRFVRCRVGEKNAADVTQETFLKVWKKALQWKPTGDVHAWILRIAYHAAIDLQRKNDRTACVQVSSDPEAGTSHNVIEFALSNEVEPSATLDQDERREQVRAAIARLGPRERQAITLSYMEGKSGEECAEIMGETHENFRQILARARNELRELLAGYISDE